MHGVVCFQINIQCVVNGNNCSGLTLEVRLKQNQPLSLMIILEASALAHQGALPHGLPLSCDQTMALPVAITPIVVKIDAMVVADDHL